MTESGSVSNDLTTCPICLDVCGNPKSLPCIHAFCLKCIERHCQNKLPNDFVPCPVCRKEFVLPSNGVSGLQQNIFIQRLADSRKLSTEEREVVFCEVCAMESDGATSQTPTASKYCIDCSQSLCDSCSKPHKNWKGGSHQLQNLKEDSAKDVANTQGYYCDKHDGEQLKLYCCECKENICMLCFAVKHRDHRSREISEAEKEFRSEINSVDEELLARVDDLRQSNQQRQELMKTFLNGVRNSGVVILKTGSEIKNVIDRQVNELLRQMEMVKSGELKKDETISEECELAILQMESFHTYTRELLEKGRPSDITRTASELHDRARELLQTDVTTVNYCPPDVTFTPVDVTQLARQNFVGLVVSNAQPLGESLLERKLTEQLLIQAQEAVKQLETKLEQLKLCSTSA